MKILMVDKYHFIKGGAERYLFELSKVLEDNNNEVIHFSMKNENNFPSKYEPYFVENINYDFKSKTQKIISGMKNTPKMFYSFEAKKKISKLIEDYQPDIAHLHMIDHQLSPSILDAIKKYKIPVIQTVHQYKLACPNYRFYNSRLETVCEKCLDKKYIHAAIDRCHKGSFMASLIVSLEMYFHKFLGIYEKNIDIFHVPSTFMGEKLIQAGIDPQKVKHLFYTIKIDDYKFNPNFEDYFIYFGRLSEEKGILTLIKAVKNIKKIKLKIVGDGPEASYLNEYVDNNNMGNVEFCGNLNGDELKNVVSNAMFTVVPSEWYDNSPLVIYESFSMGKPVIASRMGGMPELVDDGENGLLFNVGDIAELEERITYLIQNPNIIKKFGESARKKAEQFFAPGEHYVNMLNFYEELLSKN